MRFLPVSLVRLALLACAPAVAGAVSLPACSPAAPAVVAPTPSASASAAAPTIDPSRPDAALVRLLAQLPEPGPLASALNRAFSADLDAAPASPSLSPLQEIAAGATGLEPLYALCCRGAASRSLRALRPAVASEEDLASTTRSLARWAGLSLAARMKDLALAGAPLRIGDLERIDEIGLVLQEGRLRRTARETMVALDATPKNLLLAGFADSWSLDPDAARGLLARVRAQPSDPQLKASIEALEADIVLADGILKRGGAQAQGEQALDSVLPALRLGRSDLLPDLLAHSGKAPSQDLRAGLAAAVQQLGGSVCLGLEWSREPLGLCAVAWKHNPDVRQALRLLEQGEASGQGRSPAAMESYLGLHDVLPLSYWLLAGDTSSPEKVRATLMKHLDAIRSKAPESLADPGRAAALVLFADSIRLVFESALDATSDTHEPAVPALRALLERARDLQKAHPDEPLVERATLAASLVASLRVDASSLLAPPHDPSLAFFRAHVASVVGMRFEHPEMMRDGLALLTSPPPTTPPRDRWHAALLAGELRAASRPEPVTYQSLLSVANEAPPEPATAEDRLQRLIDIIGALARLDQAQEAEQAFTEVSQQVDSLPRQGYAGDLVALLEATGEALLAAHPDQAARRRLERRLRERMANPVTDRPNPAEVRLYRAAILRSLMALDPCAPADRVCKADREVGVRLVDLEEKTAGPLLSDPNRRLLGQGVISLGGSSNLSISFGLSAGIGIVLDVSPRLMLVPLPPSAPGKKAPRPAPAARKPR
jgi:hypothetical protein